MTKRNKNRSSFPWLRLAVVVAMLLSILALAYISKGQDIALLNPKGYIANQQSRLLVLTTGIMLAFAGFVLFLLYFFAWRFRETNKNTELDQKAGRSKGLSLLAWGSPVIIFILLVAIMLPATQKLQPNKAIEADNDAMTVRVVAMRWKWVFLYPEHNIATVNFVQVPVDTPVRFELTADEAPMQSFWIPHLGGMLYAMTEHVNPIYLMGDTVGDYPGGAAEINGTGFAGMRFTARVSSQLDFNKWVSDIAMNSSELDEAEYQRLLEPSEYEEVATYSSPQNQQLFEALVKKYAGTHNHGFGSEYEENEGY